VVFANSFFSFQEGKARKQCKNGYIGLPENKLSDIITFIGLAEYVYDYAILLIARNPGRNQILGWENKGFRL
jgi:hypothetical protein